jgi:glycosyltransferase involved in cell wall biosynthesis
VIVCACRASKVKGVDHLFRAFDLVISSLSSAEPKPVLVYVGDGPQFQELKELRETLACRDDIVLAGYRTDVPQIIDRAVIAVVPSVWHEACPLGVLEPMSYAKPVVASDVGGVPDQIDSPDVGVLVPPANPEALANAICRLLRDPELRASIGAAARKRIAEHFERDTQIATLVALVSGSQR